MRNLLQRFVSKEEDEKFLRKTNDDESIDELVSVSLVNDPAEEPSPDWDFEEPPGEYEPSNTYEEITALIIGEGWLPDGQYKPFSTWLAEEMNDLGVVFARNSQVIDENGKVHDAYTYGGLNTDDELIFDPDDVEECPHILWASLQ